MSLDEELAKAARRPDIAAVQDLLSRGANPNYLTNANFGYSVLAECCSQTNPSLKVVRALLEAGANPDGGSNMATLSPMSLAIQHGHLNILRLLIEHGANVSRRDSASRYPIHEAAGNNFPEAVQLLLDCGADVNARDGSERTALFDAVQGNENETVRILIQAGVDINAADTEGARALHKIVNAPMALALIEAGADVNAQDNAGETPLVHLFRFASLEVLQTITTAGADLDIRDNKGKSVMEHLRNQTWRKNYEEVIECLSAIRASQLARARIGDILQKQAP